MAYHMHFRLSFLFVVITFPLTQAIYNVIELGAKTDGVTDSTTAFLSAWAKACGSGQPATIYVPAGTYLLGKATFSGPCKSPKITFQLKGKLVAPSNYAALGPSGHWLLFRDVSGVSIYGGTLDGRGSGLWACKGSSGNCPFGATTLQFNNAQNIVISGLTSINSQLYHIVIDGCTNAMLQGVKVMAPGNSPNTDGIHVQQSTGVTITGTSLKTGDDCVSVGPGTANLWIEKTACGPGHGISIGSLGKEKNEAGVQNVTYSGVKVSDVTYSDIQGSSATEVAVNFNCSPTHPCSGIELQDVKLTYNNNNRAESSCKNAQGTASGFVVPPSCL